MKFIFPKNYNFKPKLFGIIEYTTAIFDSLIALFIYIFVNYVFTSITFKVYFFITTFFPILLISILGINRESIVSVFLYMFKFIKNRNIYLFEK